MNNSSNLTQALDTVKREMQKEAAELQKEQSALAAATEQKKQLEASIKAKMAEIEQAKQKIEENDRLIRRHTDEVKKIQLEQAKKNQEMQTMQREYEAALASAKRF